MRKKGRPPKFRTASRPITVTLPEPTLARLGAIDPDRACAIVKLTNASFASEADAKTLPELVEVSPGFCAIMVGPSRVLRRIEWLRLIEVTSSRFLLILPSGTPIDRLELAIIDLIESAAVEDSWELATLQRLRTLIGSLRRGNEVSKGELLLIQRRP
jgi:hypothetical protein